VIASSPGYRLSRESHTSGRFRTGPSPVSVMQSSAVTFAELGRTSGWRT
jgi:hypothetical protein